jgi:hypothetical protein
VTATPPRADLRTLAARALMAATLPDAHPNDRAFAVADAVLAAVLPEHRRLVAEEIALKLDADADDEEARPGIRDHTSKVIERWLREAASIARDIGKSTPPAGLSATVPAENAQAVPEEADGQRAAEGPYRVGRKVGRTIYHMAGDQPSDTDELIGVMDSPALAAFAVRGMNAETRDGRVPLADVLDALRDEGAYSDWLIRSGIGRWYSIPAKDRDQLCRYLAERFDTAPEGADERNGHG